MCPRARCAAPPCVRERAGAARAQVTGLRFFTVYGPWGRPDMAYFSFSHRIAHGLPIKVYGHGTPRRDFTYVDDVVDGIVAALALGADEEVFNLARPPAPAPA